MYFLKIPIANNLNIKATNIVNAFKKLLLLTLILMQTAFCADEKKVLMVGVLSFRTIEYTTSQWLPTVEYLQKTMPEYRFELVPLYYNELDKALAKDELDFVLTNPEHYVLNRTKYKFDAIATLTTIVGQPSSEFGGVIFTRADASDINDIKDLAGKNVASPSSESFGGYLSQMKLLNEKGIKIRDIKLVFTGMPHCNVVNMVMAKKADAGFVRTGVLESMMAEKSITAASVKILNKQEKVGFGNLLSTELYPEWPLAASNRVPAAIVKKVADAVFHIEANSTAAQKGEYFGFAPPKDYVSIGVLMYKMKVNPDYSGVFDIRSFISVYSSYLFLASLFALIASLGFIITIIRDKKKIAQNVEERELFLTSIAEGLYGVNINGICTFINQAALDMLGFAKEQVLGKNQHELFHHHYENGEPYPTTMCPIAMTIQDGKVRRCEELFFKLDGRTVPVYVVASPVLKDGVIVGAMVAFEDISERKRLELELLALNESLEERVIEEVRKNTLQTKNIIDQENKINAMAEMAGIIGHHWRQPLNIVSIMVSDIEVAYAFKELDDAYMKTFATDMKAKLFYMSKLINDFSSFFKHKGEITAVDVAKTVDKVIALSKQNHDCKNLEFLVDVPPDLYVSVYENDLHHALLSVINNAVEKSIEAGEFKKIYIKVTGSDEECKIEITDEAGGIPTDIIEKIFEPYFSTKKELNGVGVGLFMAKMLVEKNMSGVIKASNTEKGALFELTIKKQV
jgi:PAS domain S-box-containing protein